ncbi:unnamed protein product (macronuclear) [Paramecium tetraurelia]|uniref:Chromosome undetermined scaffold_135, whole genome shotgun sequence n=1 Tax=Paramecium tetraurelia TaxID=5888 RepID=Q3SDA0_PARTE|nr:uncharacterized protein GSPATT00033261001 [Paramecium tetraurelia]CAI44463.1 Mini antigen [Paramecium tetraurelia]CAK63408.1 unnamed protein product [Paramecium tetraurelia]|eukprot:XP_001430806.1 hypothetical protein (macronuclear) [Paramecium tetraurelia strain d4-2]
MKEKIVIIIFILMSIIFGWTVDTYQQCQCEELSLQSECSLANCNWTTLNTCQSNNCTQFDQFSCQSHSQQCAYNSKTKSCTTFESCKTLKGTSPQNCSSQNPSCSWVSGNSCTSTQDCYKFSVKNCPTTCYSNGMQCESVTQCSQLNQTICNTQDLCTWNVYCEPVQCSSYQSADSCLFSQVSGSSIQPCLWKSGACVNALSEEVFNSSTCFTHTGQSYHWTLKEHSDSAYFCKSCHQFLFTISIVIIVLFL